MSDNPLNEFLDNQGIPSQSEQSEQSKAEDIKSLTPEQEALIVKTWNDRPSNPPSLKELVQICFGGEFDGRDKRAKLIKAFLANRSLKAAVSYEYVKKGEIELTNEQKEFIANHVASMTCLEMAEMLFNKKLTNLSQETRTVISYARTLNNRVQFADPKDLAISDYKSPKSDSSMIQRVNKYIDDPINEAYYSKNEKQKKYIKAMLAYMNAFRFIQQINTYSTGDDRDLFESSFISYTYGKDDLTPEERDQYIILSSEVVISKNILRRIEDFQRMADEVLNSSDNDKKTISMSLVEAISGLRKEYNDCVKRQQSLMDDLKGKRSQRIKEKNQGNESLVSLVEFWKNEECRKRLAQANMERKKELEDEAKRLSTMDALKFEIWGVGVEEVIN